MPEPLFLFTCIVRHDLTAVQIVSPVVVTEFGVVPIAHGIVLEFLQ